MLTSHYTVIDEPFEEYEARELQEFVELLERLNYFVVRLSGSYAAAVELLEKHGIKSRLSIEELENAGNPIDLLADIMHLGHYLESIREEQEYKREKAKDKAQGQD